MHFQELLLCALGGLICYGTIVQADRLGGRLHQVMMMAIGVVLLGSGVYRL